MKTADLILSMSEDIGATPPVRLARAVVAALAGGFAVSAVLFWYGWSPRPGLAAALAHPLTVAKTVLPLVLAALALPFCLARARPAGRARAGWLLWLLPAAAAALFVYAFAVTPAPARMAAFLGHSIPICLPSIPTLSLPLLVALLAALRRGAPERPWLCGAGAGLIAAGLATGLYSLFCTEDLPLFYSVWYSLGILITVAIGGIAGRHFLRW